MGRCESATTYVGIVTTFKHIFEVFRDDEKAVEFILSEEFTVMDSNGMYNSSLQDILEDDDLKEAL